MSQILVFKMRMVDRNASGRESLKQDDAALSCRQKSLLTLLEAENFRLRQAVVELSVNMNALRGALKRMEARPSSDHIYRLNSFGRADERRGPSLPGPPSRPSF